MAETIHLTVQEQLPVGLTTEQARVINAVSPTAEVERVDGGAVLTVHDLNGTTTATLYDGAAGSPGERGPAGPAGQDGSPGRDGVDGYTPIKGVDYFDGADGQPGADGHSPVVTASKSGGVTTVSVDGTPIATINDGSDGSPGQTGPQGEPGEDYVLTAQDKADIAGLVDVPVTDVQVNGTSVLSDGVANVPLATATTYGAVRTATSEGIEVTSGGSLRIYQASESQVKGGTHGYRPITPARQHNAAFYGLAKAAGDSTQSASDNAVGTYTNEAKAAIKTMLGVTDPPVTDVQVNGTSILVNGVADLPVANDAVLGVVKVKSSNGIGLNSNNELSMQRANDNQYKNGNDNWKAVTPYGQHRATFYGLAKAAGADMSSSSNTVGTYTEQAKSAISTMLNGAVSVTGTTPTITCLSGVRYVCGEVSTIDITPCASGVCDVVFTSGSTPAVLTVPSTVKWANGFDPTSLEADTTYEINILDGVYGVVGSWT